MLLTIIQIVEGRESKMSIKEAFQLKDIENETVKYLKNFNDCCAELRKKSEKIMQTFDDNCYKLFDKHPIFDRIELKNIITAGAKSKRSLNFNLSREYIDIEKEVRAMFFIELFSLCRNFFSELRYIISEKEEKMQPLSSLAINYLFSNIIHLQSSHCLRDDIKENIFAFKKLYSLSFMEILQKMEKVFCNKADVSKKDLLTCLYTTPRHDYDRGKDGHIQRFFFTLASFMRHDSKTDPVEWRSKFKNSFKNKNRLNISKDRGEFYCDLINEDYADCLVIEMKTEYKNSVNRRQEPGFKAYNESLNVLRGCCFSGNDNLVTATCKKPEHNKLINDIRYKHCNTIIDDFNELTFASFNTKITQLEKLVADDRKKKVRNRRQTATN